MTAADPKTFRLATWNLLMGGGTRKERIVNQLVDWQADIVVLAEHRAHNADDLRTMLDDQGLSHLVEGPDPKGGFAGVLVASRYALEEGPSVLDSADSHRWIHVHVQELGWSMVGCCIPGSGGPNGRSRKREFWNAVIGAESNLRETPTFVTGDFNTGSHYVDEKGATFIGAAQFEEMLTRGWTDAFRSLHGDVWSPSWWSRQARNGFRLDHVLVSPDAPGAVSCSYETMSGDEVICGPGKGMLSDHAAMLTTLPILV